MNNQILEADALGLEHYYEKEETFVYREAAVKDAIHELYKRTTDYITHEFDSFGYDKTGLMDFNAKIISLAKQFEAMTEIPF